MRQKKVENLVPGDVLFQDGVPLIVREVTRMPGGEVALQFEKLPPTKEATDAFLRFLERMGAVGMMVPSITYDNRRTEDD